MHKPHIKKQNLSPARDRMWQSIRIIRRFTIFELMATSEVGYDNARRYVHDLAKAGILKCTDPGGLKPGSSRSVPGRWKLARDLGPKAPQMRRIYGVEGRHLFDHNSNDFLHMPGCTPSGYGPKDQTLRSYLRNKS